MKQKITIIGAGAVGAATAFAFAREGAKVVLVYKKIDRPFDESKTDRNGADRYFAANAGNADAVENKLKEMNADYLIIESDISDEESVKDIYAQILAKYQKVDILVNNAADGDMDGIDTIEKITQSVIDETFAVNVRGSLLMIREFVNHRGDYGRIVNLSTDAAQVFAGQITYGASKATLEALTRSIALETAAYGITVNCVAPGPTQTGWIDADFEKEVARAKTAEKANADAIALKASQKEVDELSIKVTQLESNELIASLIEAAVVKEMEEYLAAVEEAEFTASAGGGAVAVTVSGKKELLDVTISPEACDPDDVEMLQDMVIAAVNEAMRAADTDSANNMSRLAGGMNLGGLF